MPPRLLLKCDTQLFNRHIFPGSMRRQANKVVTRSSTFLTPQLRRVDCDEQHAAVRRPANRMLASVLSSHSSL
jgi:hypothetical protein